MKKLALSTTLAVILSACSNGSNYDIREINAKRNSAEAMVTTASAAQADLQRDQELKERILARQKSAMDHQDTTESINSIGNAIDSTIGRFITIK